MTIMELGPIELTVSRFKYQSGSNKDLRTVFKFKKSEFYRLSRLKAPLKAVFMFGSGTNLGRVRIYIASEQGLTVSNPNNGVTLQIQSSISEKNRIGFYGAHTRDIKNQKLTGMVCLNSDTGVVFIEACIMPASYNKTLYDIAVRAMPEAEKGWHMLRIHKSTGAMKSKNKPVSNVKPAEVEIPEAVISTTLASVPVSVVDNYVVIRESGDSEVWLRRDKINIDAFRVINSKSVITMENGTSFEVSITPERLIEVVGK